MKYYIVLQPTIRAIGGEEMYTRNIILSSREKGYVPIVFHSGIGGDKVYIEDLKPFDEYVFPLFRYEPCVVPNYKKLHLIRKIRNILVDYDKNSIIESHEILVAEWGEWIAKNLGICHFAYMLLEHNTLTFRPLYDLFKFKYDRRELAGIVDSTIPDMFMNYCKDIEGRSLPAHCTNVYENIPCPNQFKVRNADYVIGSIGRTNKQYVLPMVDSIIRFVSCHPDKSFIILYVGGSMVKSSEKQLKNRLSMLVNAHLIFTGLQFPLSVDMIRQMDVCLASAGSCQVSYNCGVPTIVIDGNDSKAIGLYKETTNHSLFRSEDEPPIEIEKLLEEVLIQKKYVKSNNLKFVNVDFSAHWRFIEQMSKVKDYFDINLIHYPFKKRLIARFLGFYYGLKSGGFASRSIGKLLKFLNK